MREQAEITARAERPRRRARRLRHVVALGGGTGLPTVLRGLRRHLPRDCRITAIVTAADDGGSSGILRTEYGVLPPGDVRNCLVALARVAPELTAALQCRLTVSAGPAHAVGNLLLTALDMVAADEVAAIRWAATLLGIDDVILPSTTARVHLVAELANGRQVRGESAIARGGAPVRRLSIDPPDASPAAGVVGAIRTADAIIVGPGSLYTSILATLVVPGITEAVVAARGVKIFVCNLMTEAAETDCCGVAAHVAALTTHGFPPDALDYIILNDGAIRPDVLARYAAEGTEPVRADFVPPGRPLVVADDIVEAGPVIRHDADKLGTLLCAVAEAAERDRARGADAPSPTLRPDKAWQSGEGVRTPL